MAAEFSRGDRVRVRRDPEFGPGPWPDEPSGTVDEFAAEVVGPHGALRMYWVVFDQPQYAPDGDGPYSRAEVAHIYVEDLA